MAEKQATLILKIKSTGERALKSAAEGLKKVGAAVGIAGAAVGAFVTKSVFAYKEQEKAISAFISLGIVKGLNLTEWIDRASEELEIESTNLTSILMRNKRFIWDSEDGTFLRI